MMNLETYNKIKKELGSEVGLIAVSKGQSRDKILKLYNLGHRDFGENFLQELVDKKNELPNDIRWHFLGNIQSNKLSKIIESSYIIHSISRHKIYELLIDKGKDFNLSNCGMHAMDIMRMESGFLHWGHDISPEENQYQAGLSFTISDKKDIDFIGKQALEKIKKEKI